MFTYQLINSKHHLILHVILHEESADYCAWKDRYRGPTFHTLVKLDYLKFIQQNLDIKNRITECVRVADLSADKNNCRPT